MICLEEQFLLDAVKLEKLYRGCVREAACGCRLTPNEIAVLLFLRRHAPEKDTATDIAQIQGISRHWLHAVWTAYTDVALYKVFAIRKTGGSYICACVAKA